MNSAKLKVALAKLPKWKANGNKITRTFIFQSFPDAFAFMTHCALKIEALDHHPEWSNVYTKLKVDLSTHDAGGVTAKDLELAAIMDKIAKGFKIKG